MLDLALLVCLLGVILLALVVDVLALIGWARRWRL
jgi:hypothetical protein